MWDTYLCPPKNNYAALVKGLRRLPFTEESRVRIPYVVQQPAFRRVFLCSKPAVFSLPCGWAVRVASHHTLARHPYITTLITRKGCFHGKPAMNSIFSEGLSAFYPSSAVVPAIHCKSGPGPRATILTGLYITVRQPFGFQTFPIPGG